MRRVTDGLGTPIGRDKDLLDSLPDEWAVAWIGYSLLNLATKVEVVTADGRRSAIYLEDIEDWWKETPDAEAMGWPAGTTTRDVAINGFRKALAPTEPVATGGN